MNRRARTSVLGALLVLSPAVVSAQSWYAALSGLEESPPNPSPGTGWVHVSLAGDFLIITGAFASLVAPTTAAHLHCCAPAPANTGVAVTTPSLPGFPLGVTSGSFNSVLDLTLASSFSASFVTSSGGTLSGARTALIDGMNNSQAYFNIHSQILPGGELRGFVVVTPEPSTLVLFAAGMLATVALSVGRRRASR